MSAPKSAPSALQREKKAPVDGKNDGISGDRARNSTIRKLATYYSMSR